MTDADWQALGRIVRDMQAEMRTMRSEMRTIRTENALLQNAIANAFSLLSDRIAQFESTVEARLDRIEQLLKDRP